MLLLWLILRERYLQAQQHKQFNIQQEVTNNSGLTNPSESIHVFAKDSSQHRLYDIKQLTSYGLDKHEEILATINLSQRGANHFKSNSELSPGVFTFTPFIFSNLNFAGNINFKGIPDSESFSKFNINSQLINGHILIPNPVKSVVGALDTVKLLAKSYKLTNKLGLYNSPINKILENADLNYGESNLWRNYGGKYEQNIEKQQEGDNVNGGIYSFCVGFLEHCGESCLVKEAIDYNRKEPVKTASLQNIQPTEREGYPEISAEWSQQSYKGLEKPSGFHTLDDISELLELLGESEI